METRQAIKSRRSAKHFDPDHIMPEEDKKDLLELALLSPTSFNIQNWRFVIVEDPDRRQAIRAAAWDQAQVTDASMLILLCADIKSWDKDPQRYWQEASQSIQEMIVPMIKPFYEDQNILQRDEAMRSVGISAQTLMLAAKAMGYDSCPMIGFDADKVAEIINLPEDHVIGMMLVIGKTTAPAYPRSGQLSLDEVVIRDSF